VATHLSFLYNSQENIRNSLIVEDLCEIEKAEVLAASALRPLRAEVLAVAFAALCRCLCVGGAALPADGL
jgi:hypothetical protein